MKALFFPIFGILAAKKAFKSKNTIKTAIQCIRELKTHCSSKQYQVLPLGNTATLPKNLLNISDNNPLLYHRKMFSLNLTPRTRLMDFEVALTPSLFNSIAQAFNYIIIKNIDKEFEIDEFLKNSSAALVVVTKLISQLKFSELNGLLTEECIVEVEKNVKEMQLSQRNNLVVELDDIYYSFPYKTNIIKSNNDNEKTYFQIIVVYHICKNFNEERRKNIWLRLTDAKKENYATYNCRFIRDFSPNSDSQWIINGINILRMDEQLY